MRKRINRPEVFVDEMLAVNAGDRRRGGGALPVGNDGGGGMNVVLAAALADAGGIRVATVRGAGGVAAAPRGQEQRQRGSAGIFFSSKAAGAALVPAAVTGYDQGRTRGRAGRGAGWRRAPRRRPSPSKRRSH
jgi:hypothetical protein